MTEKDKKLEDFVNKLMANDTLKSPSANFTDSILTTLETKVQSKRFTYKPLITNRVWFAVAVIFLGVTGYMYFNTSFSGLTIFDKIDVSHLIKNPFENFNLNFSKTFMYAMVLLALMLCVQIPILKNYFNKRMHF